MLGLRAETWGTRAKLTGHCALGGGRDGCTDGRTCCLDGHLGGQAGSEDTGSSHCDRLWMVEDKWMSQRARTRKMDSGREERERERGRK